MDSLKYDMIVSGFPRKKEKIAHIWHQPLAALQAAAMPELYNPMPSSPQINVLYLAPGQEIISPEQFEASNPEKVATGVAKISPTMVVKYGTHVSLIEAKNMLYVAEHTSIPVPTLYAAYAYGPLDRDVGDYGSVYDTYLFMEFVEGENLAKAWGKCTSTEKQMISTDLKKHMTELRSLPAAGYIGSVHEGPVTDIILEWSTTSKGQFLYSYQGVDRNISDYVSRSVQKRSRLQCYDCEHLCRQIKRPGWPLHSWPG